MRRSHFFTTAGIIAVALVSAEAPAQIRQPDTFRAAAFEYDSYFTQDVPSQSPSDRAGGNGTYAAPVQEPYSPVVTNGNCTAGCGATCGCNACYSGRLRDGLPDGNPCFGALLPCCNDGNPWKLIDPCCDNWSFGGWINGGVLTNSDGSPNHGPVPFISTNDLLLNQLWGYAERTANTGGYGWDWGMRVDYIFGADGPDTQAFGDGGWDFGWNSGGKNNAFHTYGSAIPQLYLEVAYNDLSVKLGRFYTIIGYEVVAAPGNFFYTHAYTMNYGEPFTHTGALGEYAYSDDTTIFAGYTMGWDSGWENLNDAHTAIGGISLSRWEDATLTYAFTAGDFGFGAGDIYMNSIVLDYTLTDSWTYVFQTDLGVNSGIPGGARDAHWYGVNQYLFYAINDCWSFGARFEWFRDEDGARVGGAFTERGDYYDLSLGLNYKPNANVVIRPEVRGDWFDATNEAAATRPFANGTKNEQFLAGIDFILTF